MNPTPKRLQKKQVFTKNQLEEIEESYHETTLFYCQLCGKWFEEKQELMNHYEVKESETIFQNNEPCFDLFCDHSAGSQTA